MLFDQATVDRGSEIADFGVETVAFTFLVHTYTTEFPKIENGLLRIKAVEAGGHLSKNEPLTSSGGLKKEASGEQTLRGCRLIARWP